MDRSLANHLQFPFNRRDCFGILSKSVQIETLRESLNHLDGLENILQCELRLPKRQAYPRLLPFLEPALSASSTERDRRGHRADRPADSLSRPCQAKRVSWTHRIPRSDPHRKRDLLRPE